MATIGIMNLLLKYVLLRKWSSSLHSWDGSKVIKSVKVGPNGKVHFHESRGRSIKELHEVIKW